MEGVVGKGYHGDIRIDDLSLTDGCDLADNQLLPGEDSITTPTPPPGGSCVFPERPCPSDSTICFRPDHVCDFAATCPNGEEDSQCGTCSNNSSYISLAFVLTLLREMLNSVLYSQAGNCDYEDEDKHLCGWFDTLGYPTAWMTHTGDYWLGPGHDHTTGLNTGHYIGFPHLYTGPTDEVHSKFDSLEVSYSICLLPNFMLKPDV